MKEGGTETKLTVAFKECKGKKGCEYAACIEEHTGKAPKWAAKKCGHKHEHSHNR